VNAGGEGSYLAEFDEILQAWRAQLDQCHGEVEGSTSAGGARAARSALTALKAKHTEVLLRAHEQRVIDELERRGLQKIAADRRPPAWRAEVTACSSLPVSSPRRRSTTAWNS
jgi:hypothetical protein